MAEETMPTPRRPWYRRLPRWAWVLIGVLLLIGVIIWWRLSRVPVVVLTEVTRGQVVAAIYAPGTVQSGTETVVAATAAGRVVSLLVQRGSTVTPGQVIAYIDDTQARLQLEQAEREVDTTRAQLTQSSEPGDIYAVEQARAQLAQAQSDYRRALEAVTAARAAARAAQSQVEQAQSGIATAQARVRTARRNVQVQSEARQGQTEQVGVARARLAAARAQLANAQDDLRRQQALFAAQAVAERRVVEAQAAVDTAQAEVAEAEAAVGAAQQSVAQAGAGIEAARSQLEEAESGVETARAAARQAANAAEGTQAQVQQAQEQAATAREAITAAQARLAQVQRGERASAVEVARTRVRAAQARVTQARNALADYTIRSLVSGTVSETPVDVGDFVALGAPIARVVSPRQLYVEADVDETDIGGVQSGQTAYFTSDALPERTFEGLVTEVGASADPATNTYPVEIRQIDNATGLRVGLSVDVNLVTRTNPNALLLPSGAVVLQPVPHVWLVDQRSRLRRRDVTLGSRDTERGLVEIRSGLAEGDRVVRNPQDDFRDGQRVHVR